MEKPHIPILQVFDELKFNLGKKTLVDFVKGDVNPTIERNNLDELDSYGCLYKLQKGEIFVIVEDLLKHRFLDVNTVGAGFEVIVRTSKGVKEIFAKEFEPTLNSSSVSGLDFNLKETLISDEDKKLIFSFSFFLEGFNTEQQRGIVSASDKILCVAGAGSGKTTVLTKRIEFLIKFRGVDSKKILAITFTRKAKQEMELRLLDLGVSDVMVETFNSYCEKVLKRHGSRIYEGEVKVASYGEKIAMVSSVLKSLGIAFETFYENYFNKRQLREKSRDDLFFIFVNDVFSIIDYYKNLELDIESFYERTSRSTERRVAKIICDVSKFVSLKLKSRGLRDFSDQVIDCLRLYRNFNDLIPEFEHVLVDEFQDVNLVQFEFLKALNSKNLFAVGDPRQAIYGWRGSDVKYILNFQDIFVDEGEREMREGKSDVDVVFLKKNYRSDSQIVNISNLAISEFGLAEMESGRVIDDNQDSTSDSKIFLVEQDTELLERRFVLEAVKNSKVPRNEIFVLARTNRILENFGDFFKQNGVPFSIKSEEEYRSGEPKENEIVLATVHSIKGMEAKEVFLVSCNSLSFPNKVVDNFVFSLMKLEDDYDKMSEELRLFYVALTRAKDKVVISYTGNPSKFLKPKMLEMLNYKKKNKSLFDYSSNHKAKDLDSGNGVVLRNLLKSWRSEKSMELGVPAYVIFSNKTLEELVRIRPQTKAEMFAVIGLGEMKIAKYGDAILSIING